MILQPTAFYMNLRKYGKSRTKYAYAIGLLVLEYAEATALHQEEKAKIAQNRASYLSSEWVKQALLNAQSKKGIK